MTIYLGDRSTHRRVGSLPYCVALGCCDIGEVRIDGNWHWTTWGRNLDDSAIAKLEECCDFDLVRFRGENDLDPYRCEILIPQKAAAILVPILDKEPAE